MTDRTFIDVHILQTVPPSCINRDDTGSPKTAQFGGVRRARVSSQAWKRVTRKAFDDLLQQGDLGVRTKRVVEFVVESLDAQNLGAEGAAELAAAVVTSAGLKLAKDRKSERLDTEFLVLVSRQQAEALAALASEALEASAGDLAVAIKDLGSPDRKKQAKRVLSQGNSVDLALFGRMVANDTDLNVDASCQVAHALSVHAAGNEFDYFTAVDDWKESEADTDGPADAGAGMIGTVEFTSATLYRYAAINVEALLANLGDPAMAERGIAAFLQAFVTSMPTGKKNTFANNTLPEAVVVSIRSDQPVSYVGAFESPVQASGGFLRPAAEALAGWAGETAAAYGVDPVQTWVVGVGPAKEALAGLGEQITFANLPAAVAHEALVRVAEPA